MARLWHNLHKVRPKANYWEVNLKPYGSTERNIENHIRKLTKLWWVQTGYWDSVPIIKMSKSQVVVFLCVRSAHLRWEGIFCLVDNSGIGDHCLNFRFIKDIKEKRRLSAICANHLTTHTTCLIRNNNMNIDNRKGESVNVY